MAYNEKQLQIIRTAEALFAQKGYDGASVRDIAEAAGVNSAMISYYFGSKEGLIKALFEERTADIALKVDTLLRDASKTPWEKVACLIDDYVERIANKVQFHKIMMYEQMLEKNTLLTELLNELRLRNADKIRVLLQQGQDSGDFAAGIDVQMLMFTLFGTVTNAYFNREFYREAHGLQGLDEVAFQLEFRNRIRNHIQQLFKALLAK
ncbi:TetR/AcrR family transcriptional regulator [Flaviaesturariibacter aridisoli]|uniref:TetR/AcrR family transcriptional regulator n=1 Tax=Flaviaesturariibacter aridisoli TaxID=2545761 RepID=A0A4R4E5C2_9BACT|nr:TetR/AcrR family transcriptional regulator [Flaviaesturariibacter aridisoli]TCZ74826.1 TetR/AcrR family transcriptional regulator [Flaviaesturariibacter aridisoli]